MKLMEYLCLCEDSNLSLDPDNVRETTTTDVSTKLQNARDLLIIFVQQNFLGCRRDLAAPTDSQEDYRAALEVDSENLNVNVRNPELLLSSKRTFQELYDSAEKRSVPLLFWKLRSIIVHQHVLDERTGALYSEFKNMVSELEAALDPAETLVTACATLEIVQGFLLFRRITEAGVYLRKVKELLKTQLKLVSMLGFRTRFQTKPLPQLALKVISAAEDLPKSSETHSSTQLPKLLLLEDDTRLEKVKFVNESHGQIDDLASVVQCLIITEMFVRP